MSDPATVIGDALGVAFPTTIETLALAGPDFLTDAFHATSVLAPGHRVAVVTDAQEFFGGGMGRKLLLSVTYNPSDTGLDAELFVKFPRDFGDPLRDLFGPLMEPECRFALLSLQEGFPIAVPKCYFADYNAATTSGILVTERIRYGEAGIEARHEKCMDYSLDEPLAHYQALTVALARLCGHHKAGRFGPETERQFPFDPARIDAGAAIPYTPAQLDAKLAKLQSFAQQASRLFEPRLCDPAFLAGFVRDAPLVLKHETAIRRYLNGRPDFVALCHWNMNLDNAWFWREEGVLRAGLLDWGSVGQMNVAQAFYGMTCGAETDFLNTHKRGLMSLFVDEYRRSGGPEISADDLAVQVKLATALLGIAWILDAPSLIQAQIPDVHTVAGRHDPKLKDDFLARAQLQLLMVFLNDWQADDIGAALQSSVGNETTSAPALV